MKKQSRRVAMRGVRSAAPRAVLRVAALGAILLGLLLGGLTDLASRTDIGGPHWSLRGNGALAILFVGLPTVLAAGWVMLAFWRREAPGLLQGGVAAGGLALGLAALGVFGPIFGLRPELPAALPVVALLGGLALTVVFASVSRNGFIAGAVAWALVMIAAIIGRPIFFLIGPMLVAPILAAPFWFVALLTRQRGQGQQAAFVAASALLPVGAFLGVTLAALVSATWFPLS